MRRGMRISFILKSTPNFPTPSLFSSEFVSLVYAYFILSWNCRLIAGWIEKLEPPDESSRNPRGEHLCDLKTREAFSFHSFFSQALIHGSMSVNNELQTAIGMLKTCLLCNQLFCRFFFSRGQKHFARKQFSRTNMKTNNELRSIVKLFPKLTVI